MRDYELVYIVSPEVGEENLSRVTEKVNQFIAVRGGQVDRVNSWGKRRLAYPLGPYRDGIYFLTYFKMDPAQAQDLENSLRTTEEVLRHLVVRLDEAEIRQQQQKQEQERQRLAQQQEQERMRLAQQEQERQRQAEAQQEQERQRQAAELQEPEEAEAQAQAPAEESPATS